MGTIGDTLREARMRQQIDIAEVEEITKIRAKYLRALENEEFSLLPDAPRARSFLRTYAEALGLDARMLVEEYRANYEPVGAGHELHPVNMRWLRCVHCRGLVLSAPVVGSYLKSADAD